MAESEIEKECRGIIDSEYDNLNGFEKSDLYDYLYSLYPDRVTKELSDKLYDEMF